MKLETAMSILQNLLVAVFETPADRRVMREADPVEAEVVAAKIRYLKIVSALNNKFSEVVFMVGMHVAEFVALEIFVNPAHKGRTPWIA